MVRVRVRVRVRVSAKKVHRHLDKNSKFSRLLMSSKIILDFSIYRVLEVFE
jgi:hypothetical protein